MAIGEREPAFIRSVPTGRFGRIGLDVTPPTSRPMLKSLFTRRTAIDVEQAMRQGAAFQGEGRLSDAESMCGVVLKAQPGHFEALHLLGVIKLQQGKYVEADKCFADALLSKPDSASAHSNRGSALLGIGRPGDALESFDKALAINPDSADA